MRQRNYLVGHGLLENGHKYGWIENEARELFSWAWAARKWPEMRVDSERGKEMSKMGGNTAMKRWIDNEAKELFSSNLVGHGLLENRRQYGKERVDIE
jgi:hypothetical protein